MNVTISESREAQIRETTHEYQLNGHPSDREELARAARVASFVPALLAEIDALRELTKVQKPRERLQELVAERTARQAGEGAAIRNLSEKQNPFPEGSGIYCAWQNGYWGERSHTERVAILKVLCGEDLDNQPDADPVALVAARLEEIRHLRSAITRAGFAVMQTSGDWSIHDVSEQGKAEGAKSLEVATENVYLSIAVEKLQGALKFYAAPDTYEMLDYLGRGPLSEDMNAERDPGEKARQTLKDVEVLLEESPSGVAEKSKPAKLPAPEPSP